MRLRADTAGVVDDYPVAVIGGEPQRDPGTILLDAGHALDPVDADAESFP